MPAPVVEVDHATAVLGGRTVWTDVTASVGPGEFVAVLGPNGAGKSTLLRAMLGQVRLAAGAIRVLSRPAGAANGQVGFLPQRGGGSSSAPIRGLDVVRLGLDGHRWGLPRPGARARAATARVREVVALVGADGYAHRPIGELSGGEQQRILIAQALVHRPRLLLLDEPLDSLDLPHQAAVAALLSRVSRSEGCAVVIVAHDLNPLLTTVDQVIYLGRGLAVAGPPAAVVTADALSALYGTPIEVLTTAGGRLVVLGQPDAIGHRP